MPNTAASLVVERQVTPIQDNRTWNYCIKPHKNSHVSRLPKIWLVFDTEAKIADIGDGIERQTLDFGYAIFNRHYNESRTDTSKPQFFENKAQFAILLEGYVKQGTKLYVIAHNVGYDWVVTDIHTELLRRGWELKFFSDSKGATIAPYKKENKEIVFIDSMNFFSASLATLAQEFGLSKYEVDFYDTTADELKKHCLRDTQILDEIMKQWFSLLRKENYGSFKPTRASQSLEALKQGRLNVEIKTNQGLVQKDRERLAYYGGRTECNFIGEYKGAITALDLNSAYPSVMRGNRFPIKYLNHLKAPSFERVASIPQSIGYFGEVVISSSEALYPKRLDDKLVFPKGEFVTWLAKPELDHALKRGHIKRIIWLDTYTTEFIFDSIIGELYKKRLEAQENGLNSLALMYKVMMNSLYGKFGEHRPIWSAEYENDDSPDGSEFVVNAQTGKSEKIIHFANKEYHLVKRGNKTHSFPLISAYVTSYLRVKMIEAIERVGKHNWLYCDTDSLYVTETGLSRMQDLIDQTELGKWKIEKQSEGIFIRGLKDYVFAGTEKIKGISVNAKKLKSNIYEMRCFTSMHFAIEHNTMGRVFTYPLIKVLERDYKKGVVSTQGWVIPYHLNEFT